MEGKLHTLELELQEVKEELRVLKEVRKSVALNTPRDDALHAERLLLLDKEKRLEDKIERAMTPTAIPAPAPPGNSITLPQVLSLSSIASFLSSPPPRVGQN